MLVHVVFSVYVWGWLTDFSHVNLTGMQDLHTLFSVPLSLDPLPRVPLGPALSSHPVPPPPCSSL